MEQSTTQQPFQCDQIINFFTFINISYEIFFKDVFVLL